MGKSVSITGLKEIEQKLQAMKESVRKKHLIAAARSAGKTIVDAEKETLAAHKVTGNLHDSIGIEQVKGGGENSGTVDIGPRRKKGRKGWQGWAAHLVEFGTSGRRKVAEKQVLSDGSKFYGQEVAPMPAMPFVRPAWDQNAQKVSDDYKAKLAKRIMKAAKKK